MGKIAIVRKLMKIEKEIDKNPELEKRMRPFVKKYDLNNPSCLNLKVAKKFIKEYEKVRAKYG